MTTPSGDDRVNRMLTHMRAFQKLPGRWDEGVKGRTYAQFEAAWGSATVPERQAYQRTISREARERHDRRQAASRAPVIDLAARREQRTAERPARPARTPRGTR